LKPLYFLSDFINHNLTWVIIADKYQKKLKITAKTVEIEERGVKLRLTVVDTPDLAMQ